MGTNLRDARNELIISSQLAWDKATTAAGIVGMPALVLNMTDPDAVPDPGQNPKKLPWGRLTIQHTNTTGPIGGRRRTRNGLLRLQCFFFRNVSSADNKSQLLASAIANLLEAHVGDVSLAEVGFTERPINNGFAQADAYARFYWTEYLTREPV